MFQGDILSGMSRRCFGTKYKMSLFFSDFFSENIFSGFSDFLLRFFGFFSSAVPGFEDSS